MFQALKPLASRESVLEVVLMLQNPGWKAESSLSKFSETSVKLTTKARGPNVRGCKLQGIGTRDHRFVAIAPSKRTRRTAANAWDPRASTKSDMSPKLLVQGVFLQTEDRFQHLKRGPVTRPGAVINSIYKTRQTTFRLFCWAWTHRNFSESSGGSTKEKCVSQLSKFEEQRTPSSAEGRTRQRPMSATGSPWSRLLLAQVSPLLFSYSRRQAEDNLLMRVKQKHDIDMACIAKRDGQEQ